MDTLLLLLLILYIQKFDDGIDDASDNDNDDATHDDNDEVNWCCDYNVMTKHISHTSDIVGLNVCG